MGHLLPRHPTWLTHSSRLNFEISRLVITRHVLKIGLHLIDLWRLWRRLWRPLRRQLACVVAPGILYMSIPPVWK